MAKLSIQLFGGLQVFGAERRPLLVPGKKVQALLAYLALQPGRPQARAKLAALLWGESGEPQARASLRQALLALRRTLGLADDELITAGGETIELASGCVDVDVLEFERLVDDGSFDALEAAARIHSAELLEGHDAREPAFEDWLIARRQQLRERAIDALLRLLTHHVDSGHTERAIEMALRLLSLDPLQEGVHRALMQLYAKQGRQASALRQFQLCRDLLKRELGTEPEPRTQRLREKIECERALIPSQPANAPAPAAEVELRIVAIVVAESRRAAEEADPERAEALGEQFSAHAGEVIARFGGALERRSAAAVMAFFGATVAHGDDAERAARCALQLRDVAPALGVGLSMGAVLVTRHADPTRPFSVTGEPAALATRLAAAAVPGDVLISNAAWQSVSRFGEGMRCTEAALPASLRPLGCWRLTRIRPLALASTSVVGRRTELGQFAASLDACRKTGTGLVIHLRGDPGIGKTRLVGEFRAIAAAQGFACHLGTMLDFGSGAEREAMRDITRGLLAADGKETNDQDSAERAAIEDALATGLVDAGAEAHLLGLLHRPMRPALRDLFDAMDHATRERGQGEVLASLLQRCSARTPRLIVIEDLQWASEHALAQVAVLAAACERCPAVLVTTARTDGDPLDAAWRIKAGVSALVTFDPGPLRWAESTALAAQWGDSDEAFSLLCVERAGGNPLFLEQLLSGRGDADSALPATIQSVVQARLDRLRGAERQAVRVASVLGQRFPLAALTYLLTDAVSWEPHLTRGLLRIEGTEGVFGHALLHEAAYASLPRTLRRTLHLQAARWFEGRDAILRAEHLDRAEDPSAAQAYLDSARDEAAQHHQHHALRLAERGLTLAGERGPRFALACCRADILYDLASMAAAQAGYEHALAAAGDEVERCRAWLGIAAVLRVRDDLDGAAKALGHAEQAALGRGLAEQLSRIHLLRGNLLFPRGDLEGCQREHGRGLALAREAKSVELETAALGGLADAQFLRGHMVTAGSRFGECVELAQRHGLKRVEAANRPMAAIARWYGGDTRGALEDARFAIELAGRIGHLRAEAIAHHGAYQFCHALMDFDAARSHADRSLVIARQLNAPRFEAEALAFRGELLRTVGRRQQALDELRQALAIARATGMAYMGPIFLGMLALASEDAGIRDDALAEAEDLLAGNQVAHNHLLFRRDAIDACLASHDWAGALRHAAAMEARTRSQPLAWSDFLIARARALASRGSRGDNGAAGKVLERLQQDGERLGMLLSVAAIAEARKPAGAL